MISAVAPNRHGYVLGLVDLDDNAQGAINEKTLCTENAVR
jgi:hypothetical protein